MNLQSIQFAHDLKMPIQLIYSCVQLLEMEVEPNARAASYLKLLERSADQLQSMVRSAMDEGLGEGGARLRLGVRDVVAEARAATRQCEPLARERNVRLSFRSNIDAFPMELDAEKLGRILHNLLANALRYAPYGGRVEVNVQLRGDAVDLSVADDGCGIAPERQGRIFELGESDSGSGYGLTIVREYAALMGGCVWVESVPGRGSRFTVHLPVRERADVAGLT